MPDFDGKNTIRSLAVGVAKGAGHLLLTYPTFLAQMCYYPPPEPLKRKFPREIRMIDDVFRESEESNVVLLSGICGFVEGDLYDLILFATGIYQKPADVIEYAALPIALSIARSLQGLYQYRRLVREREDNL